MGDGLTRALNVMAMEMAMAMANEGRKEGKDAGIRLIKI